MSLDLQQFLFFLLRESCEEKEGKKKSVYRLVVVDDASD